MSRIKKQRKCKYFIHPPAKYFQYISKWQVFYHINYTDIIFLPETSNIYNIE